MENNESSFKFSDYNFMRLFLTLLLKNGVCMIDSYNIGYDFADLYNSHIYNDLFVSNNEDNYEYIDFSDCILKAQFAGILSGKVQNTNKRFIMIRNINDIIKLYNEEYVIKANELVQEFNSKKTYKVLKKV